MGRHRYPDLSPSAPHESTTARLLAPGIVTGTVVLLFAASVSGTVVAALVFAGNGGSGRGEMGVVVAQGLVLVAAAFSCGYVSLHFAAACYNEPVGIVRPPELKLHAGCFILARLALVFWIVALIASGAAASTPGVCKGRMGRYCRSQIVDIVMASLAFLATGIILTALEACPYPFQSPEAFHVARKISCRVSSFGEDFLEERSVSRASSLHGEVAYEPEIPNPISQKNSLKRKPLPTTPVMSEASSPPRPITPLLPMAHLPKARGWGEEWTHLVRDTGSKGLTKSDSAISGLSQSSSGYLSSCSSELSATKREQLPRVVTPSSSISNLTKRSPLSTMRSADFPDVLVRPSLRYCPPNIPAPHEWNPSHTASLNQLLPVADIHSPQRRLSTGIPPPYRRPSRTQPPLSHQRRRPVPIRRRTIDIKVPGAFIDYRLSFDLEQNLEEHAKKIESMSVERSGSESDQKPPPPPKDQPEAPERKRRDSRSRYRENRPTVPFLQTRARNDVRPQSAKEVDNGKENEAPRFRRLSLGDMTSEFEKLFPW